MSDRWPISVLVDSKVQPDHSVIDCLAEIADTDIAAATQILDRMVRGDREGRRVSGWTQSAESVSECGMKAGGDARAEAEKLINWNASVLRSSCDERTMVLSFVSLPACVGRSAAEPGAGGHLPYPPAGVPDVCPELAGADDSGRQALATRTDHRCLQGPPAEWYSFA